MKRSIPFFSLTRQVEHHKKTILQKLQTLIESTQFIGGPYVKHFEDSFAHYVQSAHAIACNSGTDALWLALKALDIQPNTLVLTTPFSFIASSSEIVAHGAYPIFIDIDETYNISPQKIETWLKLYAKKESTNVVHKETGQKIVGILTVDLFGQCANYSAIKTLADEWNLWIIEDACQAIGAHINGKKAGTLGDIACFSLYPTKNLGVWGDGGVLTTNNAEIAKTLYKLRNHGRESHYNYECTGKNSRLDAIQALIATEKLHVIDSLNQRRRNIAHRYTKCLSSLPFIKTPQEKIGTHVYHQYCIQVVGCEREILQKHLEGFGIGTNIFYPKTLFDIAFLQPPKNLQTSCPIADVIAQTILALPIWPELTDEEVEYICSSLEHASVIVSTHEEKQVFPI